MARRRSGGSKALGLFKVPSKHKTAYEVGIIGVGALALLYFGFMSKGKGHIPAFHFPHFGGGGHPRPHPMMHHPMGHPGPVPAKAHLANILPPRAGLPVGGRISGIGGGGYNFKWGSGRLGHPGGYGVSGGYLATVG